MVFDDILVKIGEFGVYQKRLYFLLCMPSFSISALLVLNVFLLGMPNHRCKLPGYDNDTYTVQSDSHRSLINSTIPSDTSGKYEYDRCHIYVDIYNGTNPAGEGMLEKCTEWVYDESVYTSTFAKQLSLVCDDAIMIPNAQSIFFSGLLVGSVIFGQLSDLIGRRKVFYMCIWLQLISGVGLVAMVEYIGFCILLFVLGAATIGLYVSSYVMSMELVGPSKRQWTGNIIQLVLTTGDLYLVLVVFLLKSWKYFTLAVAIPAAIYIPLYWFVPESCRWLLSKNRKTEAIKILKRVAIANKTDFDETEVQNLPPATKEGKLWQLFSNKVMTARTLILFFNWFTCSMSYYGVVLNIGNLGGDFYLNFALMTAVEYPAKLFTMFIIERTGRKVLHISYLIIGGIACIGTIWPILDGRESLHIVLIVLAMIGKSCITGAFGTVYVLSSEIYPTVVRNSGMGASSAVARIGSMLAPYIAKSADLLSGVNGQAIPLTLFGASMFLSGILTTLLPETRNRPLPETIADATHMSRYTSKEKEFTADSTAL